MEPHDDRYMLLQRPSREHRLASQFVTVSLGLLLISLVVLLASYFYPVEPLTRLDIRLVTTMPQAGRPLIITIDYCKPSAWPPDAVRWVLLNDVKVLLPESTFTLPEGCHATNVAIDTSRHIAPSTYRLQIETLYSMWNGRTFSYRRETAPFTLRPADDEAPE